MTVYIESQDLPIAFSIEDLDVGQVRDAVEAWIKRPWVLRVTAEGFESLKAIDGLMINFGAVRVLQVSETPPAPNLAVLPLRSAQLSPPEGDD